MWQGGAAYFIMHADLLGNAIVQYLIKRRVTPRT